MTPEERAEKRYPAPKYVPLPEGLDEIYAPDVRHTKQFAYADCIREQVEPLEAEVSRLRALVQELTNRLHKERLKYSDIVDMLNIDHGLLSAKEQGFVPTNTEDK